MCGLIAEFNTRKKKQKDKDVNEFIINQYQDQHSRGTEGYGMIRIDDKFDVKIDRACEGTKFLLDLYMKRSKMIIAHHRRPTSTDNKMDQTHPMSISEEMFKYDYEVTHNGVVTNDAELRKIHEEIGIFYRTEYEEISSYGYNKGEVTPKWNDSESLAVELALFIEGKIKKIRTENTAAFIILQKSKKTGKALKVFFGKNNEAACLNMEKKNGILKLSSEGPGKELTHNKLFSFKVTDPQMKISKKDIKFEKIEKPIIVIPKKETESVIPKDTEPTLLTALKAPVGFQRKTNHSNQTESKATDGPTDDEPTTRLWVKNLEEASIDYDNLIEILDKSYIANACSTFAEAIRNSNTTAVTYQIDEELDEHMDKLYEIIQAFKHIMIIDKMDKESMQCFTDEMQIVMNSMFHLTAIAEKRYEIAEEEEDAEANKTGFELNTKKEEDAINEAAIIEDQEKEKDDMHSFINKF